jgi:hypothetical protein
MRCKHLFITAVMVALCLSGAHAEENCALMPVASIPIDIGADGLIFVNAEINGTPVKLRLELARILTYLSDSLANKLNLTERGGRGIDTGFQEEDGRIIRFTSEVSQIKLGQLVRNHKVADVVEHLEGIDGTIGRDWFEGYDIEINPIGHRINMFSQDHCPGKVVYWADSFFVIDGTNVPQRERLWTTVMLNGVSLTGFFDTGKSETTLSAKTAQDLFDITPENDGVQPKSTTGITGLPELSFDHVFASLDIGPLRFDNMKVAITGFTNRQEVYSRRHLSLGMDVIGRLRSFIAYKEQKIYFTLAADRKSTAAATQTTGVLPAP